jgi:hypothetical protein
VKTEERDELSDIQDIEDPAERADALEEYLRGDVEPINRQWGLAHLVLDVERTRRRESD